MCQDDFVGVNVFQGVGRNLVVYLAQLIDNFVDTVQDFGTDVFVVTLAQ